LSEKPSPLRLLLVRHGQVASNREMRYIGRGGSDEPLTEEGAGQADELAAALADLAPSAVLSSPLLRTRQTAERIAGRCGLDVAVEERLAEQSYGLWEGRTQTEVRELGEEQAALLRRCHEDPSCSPPEGESLSTVQQRVLALVSDLERTRASETIVLVSHVGPIKTLLASAMGLQIPQVRHWFLDPGTLSVVDWTRPPTLRLFNSHGCRRWADVRWMQRPSPQPAVREE
jgi:probable phosphoglycerate mutase